MPKPSQPGPRDARSSDVTSPTAVPFPVSPGGGQPVRTGAHPTRPVRPASPLHAVIAELDTALERALPLLPQSGAPTAARIALLRSDLLRLSGRIA